MRATNKDVLIFSFDGLNRKVEKAKGKEKSKFLEFFDFRKLYAPPQTHLERGWTYGFLGGEFFSAFIAIGEDKHEQMLFHELRFEGKTYKLGEGFCTVKYSQNKMSVSDKTRELVWNGEPPQYAVSFELKGKKGSLFFKYCFLQHKKSIGFYKGVHKAFDRLTSYWFFSPMKAQVKINGKGDLSEFKLGKLEELVGTTIETQFAYTERVRILVPLLSMGWYWHLLDCFTRDAREPEKIMGFMDFYFNNKDLKMLLPLNFQVYHVDLKSGAFSVFGEAQCRLEWRRKTPVLKVNTFGGKKVSFEVESSQHPDTIQIKDNLVYGRFLLHDIDYAAYPSVGKAKIGKKHYKVIGTGEVTGKQPSVWI
ncbi:MAG: hypothetical protein ACE5DI_05095 [Candidatus Micrarchaeia archaeon]